MHAPPFGGFEEPPTGGGLASARALLDPEQSMPGVAPQVVENNVVEAAAAEDGVPRWDGRPGGAIGGLRVVPNLNTASLNTASLNTASLNTASLNTASLNTASLNTANQNTANQHALRTEGPAGTGGYRSVAEMTVGAGLRPVTDAAGGRRRRRAEDAPPVSQLRVVRDVPSTSSTGGNGPGDGHTGRRTGQTAGDGAYRASPKVVGSEGYRPLTEPNGTGGFRPDPAKHAESGAEAESAPSSESSADLGGRRASGPEEITDSARRNGSARTEQSPSNGAAVGKVSSVDSPSLGLERSTIGALGLAEGSLGTGFHAYGEAAPEVEMGSPRWRESHSAPNGLFRNRAIESSLPCAAVVSQQFTAPRLGYPPAPPVRFRGTSQSPPGPAGGAVGSPVNGAAPGDAAPGGGPRNGAAGVRSSGQWQAAVPPPGVESSGSRGDTGLFEHNPVADSVSTTAQAPVGGFGLDHPGRAQPPATDPYNTGYHESPRWDSQHEPSQLESLESSQLEFLRQDPSPHDSSRHESSRSGLSRIGSSHDGLSYQSAYGESAYNGSSHGSPGTEVSQEPAPYESSQRESSPTGSSHRGESDRAGYDEPSYGSPGTGGYYQEPPGTGVQYRAPLESRSRHGDPLGADSYDTPLSAGVDYIGSLPTGALSSHSFSLPEADQPEYDRSGYGQSEEQYGGQRHGATASTDEPGRHESPRHDTRGGDGSPRYSSHFEERSAALGSLDSSGLFKSLSPRER
jgi:hypothetical protein